MAILHKHTENMRNLTALVVVLVLCPVFLFAAAPPKFTADYYLATPEKFAGQEIKLYVTHADPSSYKTEDDFRAFFVGTAYNKERGGYIDIIVPKSFADKIVKRYGTKSEYNQAGEIKSKILTGVLVEQGGRWIVQASPQVEGD